MRTPIDKVSISAIRELANAYTDFLTSVVDSNPKELCNLDSDLAGYELNNFILWCRATKKGLQFDTRHEWYDFVDNVTIGGLAFACRSHSNAVALRDMPDAFSGLIEQMAETVRRI